MAILEYLEEAFPDKPKLLPDDLFERSLVRSLALQA
jgi:glutathione S-transferase